MTRNWSNIKVFGVYWTMLMLVPGALLTAGPKASPRPEDDLSPQELRFQKSTLQALRNALKAEGGTARLYYSADCRPREAENVPFPRLMVQVSSPGATGLVALRQIFAQDKRVTARKDTSGMISVRVGMPSAAILRTKIRVVMFDKDEQYTPLLAIGAILGTKDFEDAMRTLGLKLPTVAINISSQKPAKGLPHLPPSIKNATVEQALDLIAKTFGGISVYGECEATGKPRSIWFDFIEVGRLSRGYL